MSDLPTHDPTGQEPRGALRLNIAAYPDTTVTYYPPQRGRAQSANLGEFEREDGTVFDFLWGRFVVAIVSIPHVTFEAVACAEFGRGAVLGYIHTAPDRPRVPLEHVEQLIARTYDLGRLRDAGIRLRIVGRRAGQKTALTHEQVTEVTAYVKQRRAANERWSTIIPELKRRYPKHEYEHTWNERTLRRWLETGHNTDTNRHASRTCGH